MAKMLPKIIISSVLPASAMPARERCIRASCSCGVAARNCWSLASVPIAPRLRKLETPTTTKAMAASTKPLQIRRAYWRGSGGERATPPASVDIPSSAAASLIVCSMIGTHLYFGQPQASDVQLTNQLFRLDDFRATQALCPSQRRSKDAAVRIRESYNCSTEIRLG